MASRELRTPREIAEGAADRLCAYDGARAPGDYERTAERVADFLREFVLIVGPRLHSVAQKGGLLTPATRPQGGDDDG